MSDLSSIAGQVAVITGATAGIGLSCAERFAAEGAKVAVVGRRAELGEPIAARLAATGADAVFLRGECAEEAEMKVVAAAVAARWGRCDILVNCAGGFRGVPKLEEIDGAMWHEAMAASLDAKFFITRELVPLMKHNGYGRIVNVSSLAGRTGILFGSLEYSTAKAAVIGFSRRLAVELAAFGITVNVVAPGTVTSPRVARVQVERLEAIAKAIPVGRLGRTEELAHAIWYLATPGAAFTTGAVLDVNGGVWTG
ncbi:MAG: SDR family oxidoreductase [Alphaproteobacteria bacterium]|nr:SDR family oxidoreductase [Alphaproteobacteria bacterium]